MKAHLILSQEPLAHNRTLTALCDTEVPNAQFKFMFQQGFEQGYHLNTLLCCRNCVLRFIGRKEVDNVYVYGAISGQQNVTGENGPESEEG